jgi:hypothetical protein
LAPPEVDSILDSAQSITSLSPDTRRAVQDVFNKGYNLQLRVMLFVSVVVWLSSLLLWERKPRTAKDVKGY